MDSDKLQVMAAVLVPSVRKNTDFNCMELVDAILLTLIDSKGSFADEFDYNSLLSMTQTWVNNPDTIPPVLKFNHVEDVEQYLIDMSKKQKMVESRVVHFLKEVNKLGFRREDIQFVYISGKKNTHAKVAELNVGLDAKECKADIYIEKTNGEMIGWSCKQCGGATKSNYSVTKMLGGEDEKMLSIIKLDYLTENGFPKHDKSNRGQVNRLFYPNKKDNKYWNTMREKIQEKKNIVLEGLVLPLLGLNVKYPLYEFNGKTIHMLNDDLEDVLSKSSLEEYLPYYFNKKGQQRSAAKMFYQLVVDNKKYKVEIRWKGNVHTCSPQFQIHDDFHF
jgi:hypothetical protein